MSVMECGLTGKYAKYAWRQHVMVGGVVRTDWAKMVGDVLHGFKSGDILAGEMLDIFCLYAKSDRA